MTIYIPICFYFNKEAVSKEDKIIRIYIPICFYFNDCDIYPIITKRYIYIPICFYFNSDKNCVITKWWKFTFQYVSILIFLPQEFLSSAEQFTFQYVSILINRFDFFEFHRVLFTFQYVSILIHRPNSRFFSTLFPHFLLTSQSLQIFYHISFINSTKEKQNHLFFMFVEFCRCTSIFTLSEGDSLKIVGTE